MSTKNKVNVSKGKQGFQPTEKSEPGQTRLPTVEVGIASVLHEYNPFAGCQTFEDLEDAYEAVTSPENISWDGERSGADVQKAATQFYQDASVRQRELREAGARMRLISRTPLRHE